MTNSENMLAALDNQNLELAQEHFQKALKTDDDQTLAALGQELEQIGFIIEAKEIYEQLLAQHPEYDELHLSLANIAIEDGDTEKAFEELESIPATSASYVAALVTLADLYQLLEIPEVSETKLLEAKKLAPDEILVSFALAELYFSVGQYKKAVKEYAQLNALEIEETTGISIYERIGVSYLYDGHIEHALEFLEKAFSDAQNPSDELLYQLGFAYYQLKDYPKVIHYLEKLKEQNPDYYNTEYFLAQAYLAEERLLDADDILKEGIAKNPYSASLYQLASEVAYRLKDANRAEDYLLEAITMDELRDENLYRLMNFYLQEGRLQDVFRAYQEMEIPEHAQANWVLAAAYKEDDKFEKAKEHYEIAYEGLKEDPEFLKDYALFLRENGEIAQANAYLAQAAQLASDDMEIMDLLDNEEE